MEGRTDFYHGGFLCRSACVCVCGAGETKAELENGESTLRLCVFTMAIG